MRPKKKILLAGDDEDRLAVLGYVLRTRGYRVFTAASAAAAEQAMRAAPIDLLLVVSPLDGAQKLLETAKLIDTYISTLAVSYDEDRLPLGWAPDSTVGRDQYSSAAIIDLVKMLTARKRGPKPGTQPGVKQEVVA